MSVLVVIEHRAGKPNRLSFEALAAAHQIAQSSGAHVDAVILGSGLSQFAADIARYPVRRLFLADDPLLADYTPDAFTAVLEQLLRAEHHQVVVFPHTYQVRDYAPKLAARFARPFVSDIIHIKTEAGQLTFVRQLFQGKLSADISAATNPQFVSVQTGAFRAIEPGTTEASIEAFAPHLDPARIRSKPEPPFREAQRSVDLNAAEYIVSVGRGIKEKENLPVVEALASALGAELAASRPICDNGWLPMERQVGSSGQTVAPKIYFAIGVSGAIQHLVGMKGSKTIVAINKDENAPIFEAADYGIVGDLFEIVPALVEEIKKAKG